MDLENPPTSETADTAATAETTTPELPNGAPVDDKKDKSTDPLSMTADVAVADERTPLLPPNAAAAGNGCTIVVEVDPRQPLFEFLEAQTPAGRLYEGFIILLIFLNIFSFILASLFLPEYNQAAWASRDTGICQTLCDTLWFGNFDDNYLQVLNIGSTSVLELVTIAVFSVEYGLRLYIADMEDPKYAGVVGRLRWIPTFFSVIDIVSTLPFYIDAFFLRDTDLVATSFVRMFRLFRMMRVEGRYNSALTMVDQVYESQKGILGTALFIGATTWITVSSLYYLVERRNLDMIYCGGFPACADIDTSLCSIDSWGITDCTDAGCPPTEDNSEPCYNLYQSIPMASYYALLNLFGEFPLIDQHSTGGMIVGTITSIVAVAVFALPAGIIGNGFEDVIAAKTESEEEDAPIVEHGGMTQGFIASETTWRGSLYNFLHAQTTSTARSFDIFINILVILTALSFMIDTLGGLPSHFHIFLDSFELISVSIFTVEYVLRFFAALEDPRYNKPGGAFLYMKTFLATVDLLSVAPYWIEVLVTGKVITPYSDSKSAFSNLVKSLRLLRILRFERYTHAFTSFDDVISRHSDVLAVTGFSALLVWVLFGAILYMTERDNPDPEMASYYKTVPDAMWITLLNLSGEAPLSQYSAAGKVATGILGLFATGIFGIPIGVLGAGFEEVVEEEHEDDVRELEEENNGETPTTTQILGTSLERSMYEFVNGMGSSAARFFEALIYVLIFATITIGAIQTIPGHEDDFHEVEWAAVVLFTWEYIMRFIGVGADPEFAIGSNGITSRLRFLVSFYSVIDLLAIIPFYVAFALPNSFVDDYDEYLRMLRVLRLIKLDKYVPSLSLIDDVIRLKWEPLRVAGFAALSLWVLFAAGLFLCEHNDTINDLDDPVPEYGCDDDCTMQDRFKNMFGSMIYTAVHLTGDYPIITYTWPGRFVNFFMVIAAVGVVSIPSGLIANGFVSIVRSKNKRKSGAADGGDDDWYEMEYRRLANVPPPLSPMGPWMDRWQIAVNEFVNGKEMEDGGTEWSTPAYIVRVFFFTIIIANVAAVVAESVPAWDKAVGNEPGNFFDVFEAFSVFFFAFEYCLNLFCAPKNRQSLYSPWVYATTFFGIVDLLSTAPWFVQQGLLITGVISPDNDLARIFRIFRVFRILQLEDFIVAFSKLDDVFRASQDVLKATGLLALIIWVGCGALFFIFEQNNPNWRSCDDSVPLTNGGNNSDAPGCFDFKTTAECNEYYPGLCTQKAFVNMPNSLYYTAVFLGGEWGVVDFTWPGRFVCLFLCVVGIALYAIPIGTLFDSFGAILGMGGDDEEEEEDGPGEEPTTEAATAVPK